MNYLFLGTGVGDLDESVNYRCGFTEFIKKNYQPKDNIFLIEANKLHISKLKECWKSFKNVNIFNIAIARNNEDEGIKKFYYAEESAPHFQTCSMKIDHVMKHYPNSKKIKSFKVNAISINSFINKYLKNQSIDFCSIDLEGIDFEVFMSLNLAEFEIKKISIEFQHMSRKQIREMIKKFNKNSYSYMGYGYDHSKLNFLFEKKVIKLNQVLSIILGYTRSKKIRHLINDLIN